MNRGPARLATLWHLFCVACAIATFALALAGCGGGDPEDDDAAQTTTGHDRKGGWPLECQQHPERCK